MSIVNVCFEFMNVDGCCLFLEFRQYSGMQSGSRLAVQKAWEFLDLSPSLCVTYSQFKLNLPGPGAQVSNISFNSYFTS